MFKLLKPIAIIIVSVLAVIGLLFLGFKIYNDYFFASEKKCVDQIYYTIGEFDNRHGLSVTEYKEIFSTAEVEFESVFGKDLFRHYDGFSLAQNMVTYNIEYNPEIQIKLNSLASFEVKNIELQQKIDSLLDEHKVLEAEYQKALEGYETLSNEYIVFASKQAEYNEKLEDKLISIEEAEAYQEEKATMYLETREAHAQLNELGKKVTAKAGEANELIGEDKLLRTAFDQINQGSLNRAINYKRTAISYDITILYFSDKEHLQSLIQTSFHSILDDQGSDADQTGFVMKENSNQSIDQNDLRFTLCSR